MQWGMADSRESKVGMWIVSASLGLVGVVLVLLCTQRYGVGLSPDSANYVAAARSLLAGQGYHHFDGTVCTHWPPLLPTLLAIPGLAGVGPIVAARWLNALAFGGIVFFAGHLFAQCTASRATAVLGTLSVLLSASLLAISSMAWSEPVFTLLVVLFVLCLARFARTQNWTTLLALCALAALACLQRYAGITVIAAGAVAIAIVVPAASLGQRLKRAVVFCLLSSLPLALWFLRNQLLARQPTGFHHLDWRSIGEMVRPLVGILDLMAIWFSSKIPSGVAGAAVVGSMLLLSAAAVVLFRWKRDERRDRKAVLLWSAGLFVLVYTVFIACSGAGLLWNPEPRHAAPVYVFVMLLVFVGMEDLFRLLGKWSGGRPWFPALCLVLMALWLLHPYRHASRTIRRAMRNGVEGYHNKVWAQSELFRWLRVNPLDGPVYSNVPDALYLLTETRAKITPHHYMDIADFSREMTSSPTNYVVWSHNLCWPYLYDLRELASRWRLEPVAEFPDGAVYRFLGVGGPELLAVCRFWSPLTQRHRYTIDKRERDGWVLRHPGEWVEEGAVFYAYSEERHPEGTLPVYRLWSPSMQTNFYTIDPSERDAALTKGPGVWQDQGIAWYAYPLEGHPADAQAVCRFWSDSLATHFYTIDPVEKDKLIAEVSHIWTYEGPVWYAYGK